MATETPTKQEIAALIAQLAEAWRRSSGKDWQVAKTKRNELPRDWMIGAVNLGENHDGETLWITTVDCCGSELAGDVEGDAEWIVLSRNAVPKLVAYIEAMEEGKDTPNDTSN